MTTFTSGLLILVESDNKGVWWMALPWQVTKFIESMQFGTMKSMGQPNAIEKTNTFTQYGMNYHFVIENDWGPCTIVNETTGKKRSIQYHTIGNPPLESLNICKVCK